MSASIVEIGDQAVNNFSQCEVHSALVKVQIRLAAGGPPEIVKTEINELVFASYNDRHLRRLIEQCRALCPEAQDRAACLNPDDWVRRQLLRASQPVIETEPAP